MDLFDTGLAHTRVDRSVGWVVGEVCIRAGLLRDGN